jgi:hypothetical protein
MLDDEAAIEDHNRRHTEQFAAGGINGLVASVRLKYPPEKGDMKLGTSSLGQCCRANSTDKNSKGLSQNSLMAWGL